MRLWSRTLAYRLLLQQLKWPSGKAPAYGVEYMGLIPNRVKLMTVKLVFTAYLLDVQHQRDSEENKLASLFVVPLGKTLIEIFPS